MILKKLKAVSYVEIILVLTIVGVISSIAIPSMKRHSQKTEFGALAKKAYFSISFLNITNCNFRNILKKYTYSRYR